MVRRCAACNRVLAREHFSSIQWSEPKGTRRCRVCVNSGLSVRIQASSSARTNGSTRACFPTSALERPFAQGAFRWVAKGHYTNGPRKGQLCVCKWFKSASFMEPTFFEQDIKAMKKAHELVGEWNTHCYINQAIKVNIPEVWTFGPRSLWAGRKVLQEPFIVNYRKFNSNSGWADSSTPWPQVMQALSHFSYHTSGGKYLLCDLQGGIYSNGAILTDPVILSSKKKFGVTDLGPKGISTFFSNHSCNVYCRSHWIRPNEERRYHAIQKGTSMAGGLRSEMRHVPQQRSRPALSTFREEN